MKTAEERGAEVVAFVDSFEGHKLSYEEIAVHLARMFKEYARDQRLICAQVVAEHVYSLPGADRLVDPAIFDAAVGARYPGE